MKHKHFVFTVLSSVLGFGYAVQAVAGLPALSERGWIVMVPDSAYLFAVVDSAANYGITHLQLSHDIVMNIDQILADPDRAQLIQKVAAYADQKGIDTYVWSHEVNTRGRGRELLKSEDPAKRRQFWEARWSAYRDALQACPSVDGVVLMFGSSPRDPWEVVNPVIFAPSRSNPDRVRWITQHLRSLLVDSLKRKLVVRTFIHQPEELRWVREGLQGISGITVMSKCVPQDWEPYYPHNPLIGAFPEAQQIVEFDLAGEYTGATSVPYPLPDYLKFRLDYERSKGVVGAAGRTERYERLTWGKVNELNVFAFSRLLRDPGLHPRQIWHDWVRRRFGLDPNSKPGEALIDLLRNTFDATRKTFLVKGFWALRKGTTVPRLRHALGMLPGRSIAKWDPAFEPLEDSLASPSLRTLWAVHQEKLEAQELADSSWAQFSRLAPTLRSGDVAELAQELDNLRLCSRVWTYVTDAVWGVRYFRRTHAPGPFLGEAVRRLAALADSLEKVPGRKTWPAVPADMRRLAQDVREALKAAPLGEPVYPARIGTVEISHRKDGVILRWRTSSPAVCTVFVGQDLPELRPLKLEETPSLVHEVELSVQSLGLKVPWRVQVRARAVDWPVELESGDWWVWDW